MLVDYGSADKSPYIVRAPAANHSRLRTGKVGLMQTLDLGMDQARQIDPRM